MHKKLIEIELLNVAQRCSPHIVDPHPSDDSQGAGRLGHPATPVTALALTPLSFPKDKGPAPDGRADRKERFPE
jgi:hypothetical protein